MPYRIAKSITVESGHLLSKHPGACRFPHGHSRTIEVVLVSEVLDGRDMVCDFKALKQTMEALVMRFDHSMAVNTKDPRFAEYQQAYGERIIPFENEDPTSEVMARVLFHWLKEALARAAVAPTDPRFPVPAHVRLERLRVTETASSWAEYWE